MEESAPSPANEKAGGHANGSESRLDQSVWKQESAILTEPAYQMVTGAP